MADLMVNDCVSCLEILIYIDVNNNVTTIVNINEILININVVQHNGFCLSSLI